MKITFCILLTLITLSIFGQDTITTYFFDDWTPTTRGRATYYREAVKNEKVYVVKDYFINGDIQMEGVFKDADCKFKQGDFRYYFENGNVDSKGSYENSKKSGKWEYFHENGNKKSFGLYKKNEKVGPWLYYSEDSVETLNCFYKKGKKEGLSDSHYASGSQNEKGNYKKGELDGEWKFYFQNGQMSAKEVYKKGKIVTYEFWDSLGVALNPPYDASISPIPVGGMSVLYDFLGENIVYPQSAIDNDILGKVYIQFVVEKNGEITEVKVFEGVHQLLDNEALRIVKMMPPWEPGMMHNRLVRYRYKLPINFTIN